MELFKETEKLITYRTNIEGKYYDVDYNKDNKTIIIKINSEILSDNGYKKIIGELYKESIKDIKDYKDYKFEFSPSNGLEKERSKKAIKIYDIKDKAFIKELNNNKNRDIENYFKANMVTKNENGHIKQYVERKVSNNNMEYVLEVSLDEMKDELENVLVDDSVNIDNLSEEEVANLVLDRISEKKKQYYMESSRNYEAKDEKEQAALNATKADDKVNTEIGVVKKNPEDAMGNSYRAVERDGDNYNVVNPSVNEVSSIDNNNERDDVDLTNNEIESRDEEKIYYLDNNNGDIYNKDGEKIGNLSEGYRVNSEDNSLSKDGIKLGMLDDINSMGKSNNMNKPKVRTLEKPPENAGIIDIRIMLYVIVNILLIWVIFNLLTK